MGDILRPIVDPIRRVFRSIGGFIGDFFGFNVQPMGTPNIDSNTSEREQGVLVQKTGTNEQIPVIYGFRRVGGTVVFVETNGTSNTYLYVCYLVCEGEIAGIKQIIIDDTRINGDATGLYPANTIIDVTEGKYANRCQFQVFVGTENQTQSTLLNQTATWPTRLRTLPGVAYVAMRFEWRTIASQADADNNPYTGGVPIVQFDVNGKKVFDLTTHGTGAQLSAVYGSLTKTYTGLEGTNPANCLLDYMMNPRYGCGISRDEIDAVSFKIAAVKFNQTVTYFETTTGPAMTCCAVMDTRQKLIENVKILVGACRGMMPYVQGRYRLVVEDGGNATDITSATVSIAYDVDKSEIVGGITLTGETKGTKYNQVIVNYVDPNIDFTVQQAVYRVSGDLTVDQDEELTGEFTFGTVSSVYIAKFMAESIYKKSRNQSGVEFNATQELIDVIPGDIIRITDSILNLSNKTFRVINLKLNNDGTIALSCTEHVATNYPYVPGPQIDIPPQIFLPIIPIGPRDPGSPTPILLPPTPPTPPTPPPPIVDTVRLYGDPLFSEQLSNELSFSTSSPRLLFKNPPYDASRFPNIRESWALMKPLEPNSAKISNIISYFYLNAPADTRINVIKWTVFQGTKELDRWGYIGTDSNIARSTTEHRFFGTGGQGRFAFIYNIPLYANYGYRVKFVSDVGGTVKIGMPGGIEQNWPGSYSYSVAGTVIQNGNDFEAYFNWFTHTYGASTTGPVNLGG